MQLLIFIFFFVIPFLLTVISVNGTNKRYWLLYTCSASALACQVYFLTLEMMQILVKGVKDYFFDDEGDPDMTNVVDMLSIIFGIVYVVLRVLLFEKVNCFMIIEHI